MRATVFTIESALSAVAHTGLVVALSGAVLTMKPMPRLHVATRSRALAIASGGFALFAIALVIPASESHVERAVTRLDEVAPVWQFHEVHTLRMAAPPERVFEAITRVRADEIFLFNILTWLRRGVRRLPESILNAGSRAPLLEVATRSGFVWLANDPPRELVIGTVVAAPRGTRGALTPAVFRRSLPPGFALASMNFVVIPDGAGGSFVSTETRVFANSAPARRRFAAYWRLIYPGSAIIRIMWLRAIERRATAAPR